MSRKLTSYLVGTFGLCWGWAGLMYLLGVAYSGMVGMAVALVFMLIPAGVAIAIDKRAGARVWESLWIGFRPNRWWAVAMGGPIGFSVLALAASILVPGVGFDTSMGDFLGQIEGMISPEEFEEAKALIERIPWPFFLALQVGQGLVAGATINALFAFGEEAGWRGLMLRELAAKGFWTSALIIGVIWGVWHAPLILQGHNYPGNPVLGVPMMVLFCVLLSPLFSWVTLKSRSVVAAAVMHGVLNAVGGISIMYLSEPIEFMTGMLGFAGFAVLVAANLLLFVVERPTLSQEDWPLEAGLVGEKG